MYTGFNALSPLSKILLLGTEPEIKDYSREFLEKTEIKEEWGASIIQDANRNGLLALLYHNLKNYSTAPASILSLMKERVVKQTMIQLNQEAVFRDLSDLLESWKVEYRILKGYYLAREIYSAVNLRPMVDIDLLFPSSAIKDVFEKLKEIGFKSYPVSENTFISNQKHHPYGLKYKGVSIELHRSIFSVYDPVKFDEALLWENPVKFHSNSKTLYTLSKEVFLYHLCHHIMGHLRGDFIKLIWCRDIAEFVKKFGQDLDWDYFLHLYKISGADEEFLYSLWFAKDWMNANVPEKVLAPITTSDSFIANEFLWFTENIKNNRPRPHLFIKFNQITGWKNKIIFFITKLFPDPSFLLRRNRKKRKINLLLLYPKHILTFLLRGVKSITPKTFRDSTK